MLEIACFNTESVIAAARGGADRIELCADYAAGGITPSPSTLHHVRKEITTTPINVMIRPRAGNFVYSEPEFDSMRTEVDSFGREASGFVFGILDSHDQVDVARNTELVQLAAPLPCTFHRAFDQVPEANMEIAVAQLVGCGFKAILTSGGLGDAMVGKEKVAELQRFWGSKITFILGGGVRSSNLGGLKAMTKVEWFHSAAITGTGEAVDVEEVGRLSALLKSAM